MIRYTITNRDTGNQYAITDADLAAKGCTIDEWIARKANAYGPNPTVVAEDVSAAIVAELTNRLWREAWAWGDKQFAEPDRTTVLGWLAAGKLTTAGAQKWAEVIAWHDAVFAGPYATAKAAITAAGAWVEPDWSSWPACPHTFYGFLAERI